MKQAHFYCYGAIGEPDPKSQSPIISPADVAAFINANAGADVLVVHINSPGGNFYSGFSIHDLLRNSGKKIVTIGEGVVASIASVVFLAGDERHLLPNSAPLIHMPWINPQNIDEALTSDKLENMTDDMKAADQRMIKFYSSKTGMSEQDIASLMQRDRMMTAEEAVELKFATEILQPVKAFALLHKSNSQSLIENSFMEKLEKTFNVFAKKMENLANGKGFKILALDVTTSDGQSLTVSDDDADGLPSKGDKVTDKEGKPYASQTTELSDKTKITTDEMGVITEVNAPASDSAATTTDAATTAAASAAATATPDTKDEEIKNLKEQNAALQAKVDSFQDLETKVEARMTQLASLITSNATLETGAQGFQRQAGTAAQLTKDEVKAKIKERNQKK